MKNKFLALLKYYLGIRPNVSTFVDGNAITMGYGKLDDYGDFEYELPTFIIKRNYKGKTTWSDYLRTNEKLNKRDKIQ